MAETLNQIIERAAKQIQLDEFNLKDLSELTGVPYKPVLQNIKSIVEGDRKSPLESGIDFVEKTTVKAVEMAESFLRAYDGSASVAIGHLADTLKYVPAAKRNSYLGILRVLADQEYGGANKGHVMPDLADMMSIRFASEHRQHVEDHSDKKRYEQAVKKLEGDIDRFLAYAKDVVAKNATYHLDRKTLTYENCFKQAEKPVGVDYALLSEDVLLGMANGPVDEFISTWGVPSGMVNRGIRDGTDVTLKMFFGDNGEHQVAVTYPSGLPSRHLDFFKGMATMISPIAALQTDTRKCRDFLRTL